MKTVPARVTEAQARAHFHNKRFGWLGRMLSRLWPRGAPPNAGLPRLELIWMPHYLVELEASGRGKNALVHLAVDAYAGTFMIVELGGGFQEAEPETAFPPRMDAQEAERIGRQELLRAIMRRRGQRDRPTPQGTTSVTLFYYPFWVWYYERLPGAIDIALHDAASGDKTGPKMKTAVLSAFAKAGVRKRAE